MRLFKNHLFIFFFVVFFASHVKAQLVEHRITGVIIQSEGNKFAYLFVKGDTQNPAYIINAPVQNGSFTLKSSYTLTGRLCAYGDIFFSPDSTLTLSRVVQMYKDGFRSYRSIVLEDFEITVENPDRIRDAQIHGGKLNQELDSYFVALENNTQLAFIQDHPSSPISLLHLKAVRTLDTRTQLFSDLPPLDYKLWFSKLSPALQNSVEGKEFYKLINN